MNVIVGLFLAVPLLVIAAILGSLLALGWATTGIKFGPATFLTECVIRLVGFIIYLSFVQLKDAWSLLLTGTYAPVSAPSSFEFAPPMAY